MKDNIINSDFLGLTIGDIIGCGLIELLPVIKELYDKNYVSTGINGSFEEVEEYLKILQATIRKGRLKIFLNYTKP